MIYQTVSVRTLVAKLYRDLRLRTGEYDLDLIEWTGEALSHIGAFPQLETREAVLEVESHRAALPVALVQLLDAAYVLDTDLEDIQSARKKPLKESSSTFHVGLHTTAFTEDDLSEETFTRTPGYLHTSFESGLVVLSYLAYPLDEDGLPTVPDDPSFFDACKWYCAARLTEGGWRHPAGLSYEDCEARWFKYCAQARTKALTPDAPRMERFMETWLRLVPDLDAPNRFFVRGDYPLDETPYGTDWIDLEDLS